MRVAAIQAAPVFLDSAATTDRALEFLRQAASGGAELIAFPEVFIAGYPSWLRVPSIAANDALLKVGHIAYLRSAIAANGPELAAIWSESAKLGVFVYVGFLERTASGGSVYASLAAIHPDKGIVGVHRKLKPTFHERLIWSDGDGRGLEVHDFKGLRAGALNCYENWLPLARQALYAQGEQLHVAVWPGDLVVTENISQFIAMEGRVYVISASGLLRATDIPDAFPLREHIVTDRRVINDGGSMIVAPGGLIIAGPVIGEEKILYADIDVEIVMGEHLKLDPAGHYSRDDVLRLKVNRDRYNPSD
ncbi:carbon-nitrogen hydrolase family protein [Ancylobacter dichloromethanicus]|nr:MULTISPECIES: carbon-nitrogen hydrolase family protein [Hyphomicrobiales]MBS7554722.1 carbon-nitrogen hydrolase family protein [Ancylobacter dichloromethanicus]CAX24326.1 putative nitrilase/amidohydrolase [Methylorubrum extorquens DM4]